jgi:hypothetical protein
MLYPSFKSSPLCSVYANTSLDLVGSGGFREVDDIISAGAASERELMGSLRTLQLVEDRFIISATGGFAWE